MKYSAICEWISQCPGFEICQHLQLLQVPDYLSEGWTDKTCNFGLYLKPFHYSLSSLMHLSWMSLFSSKMFVISRLLYTPEKVIRLHMEA